MLSRLKKSVGSIFFKYLPFLLTKALHQAAREQGLTAMAKQLEIYVPDISEQYTTFKINNPYLIAKVRGLHAFQIALVNEVIGEFKDPIIVDIGDSAGTHLQYILKLYSGTKNIRCLSINLDEKAIDKIKQKGLEAIHARAEDLDDYNINPDIFLCFETLEHLMDPCHFLYQLSLKTKARYLILTVPYQRHTRVGLYHIRGNRPDKVCAENTHIFEFSPQDLKLIAQHAGWKAVKEKIYLQYPKRKFLRFTKMFWKKYDFEGFYGVILKKDTTFSSKYMNW